MTTLTARAHHSTEHLTSDYARIAKSAAQILWAWYDRSCQRHALSGLTHEMLNDIGITQKDALAESAKPFWAK